MRSLLCQTPKVGAVCGNAASTDLCGGPPERAVHTATFDTDGHSSDGITFDVNGNRCTTQQEIRIYDPSGDKLGEIKVPESPTNACFGGDDYKTLFITARASLYSIRMQLPGAKPLGAKW